MDKLTDEQKIEKLLQALCNIEEVEYDNLKQKEISWIDDDIDYVQGAYFGEEDGTYQEESKRENYPISYEEARSTILTRIYNSIETLTY